MPSFLNLTFFYLLESGCADCLCCFVILCVCDVTSPSSCDSRARGAVESLLVECWQRSVMTHDVTEEAFLVFRSSDTMELSSVQFHRFMRDTT